MDSPKERIIAAFEHSIPVAMVPAWDIEFHPVEEFFGKSYQFGDSLLKLSTSEKEKAFYSNAELLIEIAEEFNQSAIHIPGGYWKGAYIWLPTIDDEMKSIRILKELVGDKYLIIANRDGTFGIPEGNEILNFVYRLNDKPQEVKDECAKRSL